MVYLESTHGDQEGFSTNKDPLFDGENYEFQRIMIQTYIIKLGFDIWKPFLTGYITPKLY
jgi:hypothetical protein